MVALQRSRASIGQQKQQKQYQRHSRSGTSSSTAYVLASASLCRGNTSLLLYGLAAACSSNGFSADNKTEAAITAPENTAVYELHHGIGSSSNITSAATARGGDSRKAFQLRSNPHRCLIIIQSGAVVGGTARLCR
jgi:hypothetical protein